MRYLLALSFALISGAAFAADEPPPAPPSPVTAQAPATTTACPANLVCMSTQFVQQAVLQLGLRDQIGQAMANALQQSQEAAQHHAEPSKP